MFYGAELNEEGLMAQREMNGIFFKVYIPFLGLVNAYKIENLVSKFSSLLSIIIVINRLLFGDLIVLICSTSFH